MSLKIDIWELIEKEIPNASDEIGWGSMDSLCGDISNLLKETDDKVKISKKEYDSDQFNCYEMHAYSRFDGCSKQCKECKNKETNK